MHNFKLKIISPEQTVFDREVFSVNLKTKEGEITILKDHTPLISLLSVGAIKVSFLNENNVEKIESFNLSSGSLEVKSHNEGVVILTDELLDIEKYSDKNLDDEIKQAKEKAAEAMQNEDGQFAIYEGEMEKYIYLNKILKNRK